MLTNQKFENRPVHLFHIDGLKIYVTRNIAPCLVAVQPKPGVIGVLAPQNVSYQQAAMKAAHVPETEGATNWNR